jgi:hypothetical protein
MYLIEIASFVVITNDLCLQIQVFPSVPEIKYLVHIGHGNQITTDFSFAKNKSLFWKEYFECLPTQQVCVVVSPFLVSASHVSASQLATCCPIKSPANLPHCRCGMSPYNKSTTVRSWQTTRSSASSTTANVWSWQAEWGRWNESLTSLTTEEPSDLLASCDLRVATERIPEVSRPQTRHLPASSLATRIVSAP